MCQSTGISKGNSQQNEASYKQCPHGPVAVNLSAPCTQWALSHSCQTVWALPAIEGSLWNLRPSAICSIHSLFFYGISLSECKQNSSVSFIGLKIVLRSVEQEWIEYNLHDCGQEFVCFLNLFGFTFFSHKYFSSKVDFKQQRGLCFLNKKTKF